MLNLTLPKYKMILQNLHKMDKKVFGCLMDTLITDDLINLNMIDEDNLRLHIELLIRMCEIDLFYENMKPTKYTLELILTVIATLEKFVEHTDIFSALLHLFRKLLTKIKKYEDLQHQFLNIDRILYIFRDVVQDHVFRQEHVDDFAEIICLLLSFNVNLSRNAHDPFSVIFEKLKEFATFKQLIDISNIVILNYPSSSVAFSICCLWFLQFEITEVKDENTVLKVLQIIKHLYVGTEQIYGKEIQERILQYQQILMKNSDVICIWCCSSILREDALTLLSMLMIEGIRTENISLPPTVNVLEALKLFPEQNLSKWCTMKYEFFFYLCHFLYLKSRILWKEKSILKAIGKLLYSMSRFKINRHLLKTLCFLQPVLSIKCSGYTIVGDDLFRLFASFNTEYYYEICSYNVAQLYWILKRCNSDFKSHILGLWLLYEDDVNAIKTVVEYSKSEETLLNILMGNYEPKVYERAIDMTNTIKSNKLSKEITLRLVTVQNQPEIFNRLISCYLVVPDNKNIAIQYCYFLSSILPTLTDERIIRHVCAFSREMLIYLKMEKEAFFTFCSNIKNIQFLTDVVNEVQDETAKEILKLMKMLQLVQKRNHLDWNEFILVDPTQSLRGSDDKIEKAIDLILITLSSSKKLIFQINESKVLDICQALFNLCTSSTNNANNAYFCISSLLHRYKWLINSSLLNSFIQLQCTAVPPNKDESVSFTSLLQKWINAMNDNKENVFCFIVDESVESFIQRSPMPIKRVKFLLRLMKQIRNKKTLW